MEGLVEIVVYMLQAQKKKPDTKAKKPGGKEEFTEQILSVCMRKAEHKTCAVLNFAVLVVLVYRDLTEGCLMSLVR